MVPSQDTDTAIMSTGFDGIDDGHEQGSSKPASELELDEGISICSVGNTGSFHVTLEPDADSTLDMAIVRSIAALNQIDPLELEPLAHYIDPESLRELFESNPDTPATQPTISFSYAGYCVTVESPDSFTVSR